MKKRNFWKIPMAVFAVFTVICVAAIPITNYFAPMINVALNAETQRIIPDPDAQIFYWTRYDSEEELVANDWNVCRQVMAEFCDPDAFRIFLVKDRDDCKEFSLRELLPGAFTAADLEKGKR